MAIRPEPGLLIDHVGKLRNDTYCVAYHCHALWEAVYYTSGAGTVVIGTETVPFETGDVFVIPPGLYHSDFADQGFQDVFFTFEHFERPTSGFLRVHDTEASDVLRIMLQLHDTFQRKPPNWINVVNAAFRLFEQTFLSLLGAARTHPLVERAVAGIVANLSNPAYRVDRMAEDLHLSGNYFRDLFRREMGMTPLQFLTRKRIEHAQQLLLSRELTGYSMKEVARMSGFYDPYFFSRTFRKWTGAAPSRWRP